MRKTGLILISTIILLIAGVLLSYNSSFAVTFFSRSPVSNNEDVYKNNSMKPFMNTVKPPINETGRAPEPTTLVLFLGGISGMLVRFVRRSFKKFKRYMDILLATFGIMVSLPVLTFVAILIKLSSRGSVVYKQNRVGENGTIFQIYKLRTMRFDAEKGTGAVWAKKNDPRITSVGRVLRKTHIDEIPQLINVIKGEMSIVGPRPERPEMVRDFKNLIIDYEKRLQVKPGITGLAQVWHKYDESIQDVKKKVKYDLLYIKKMCLWVDLRIMMLTCVSVVTGRGAN